MFTSSVPLSDRPLKPFHRVLLSLISLGVLGVLMAAACLTPDPKGFGTHQQFGLPPCSFRVMFGIPCPSCGGTTSFAHFVRGEWPAAIRANAAGFCGALLSAVYVPWGLWSSLRGRLWGIHQPLLLLFWILVALTLLALAQWGLRIAFPEASSLP